VSDRAMEATHARGGGQPGDLLLLFSVSLVDKRDTGRQPDDHVIAA